MRENYYNGIYEVYDDNNNLIYYKDNNTGYEVWYEYDEFGNCTYIRNSEGYECHELYDVCGTRKIGFISTAGCAFFEGED